MRGALGAAGGAAGLLFAVLLLPFLFLGAPAEAAPQSSSGGKAQPVGGGSQCAEAVGCQQTPEGLWYVPAGFYPDGYTNPPGECTSWAAALWPGHHGRGVTWSGDAWEWLANAAAQGYATSSTPTLGAIAVWPRHYIPGNDATQYGHVAVVTAVASTTYTVTEMNVLGTFRVDTRTIDLPGDQAGFLPVPQDAF